MKPDDLVPFFFGGVIVAGAIQFGVLKAAKNHMEKTIIIIIGSYLILGIGLVRFKGLGFAGQLGDFMNPVIALVSAMLIYRTIKVQIEANRTQKEGLEKETEYRNVNDEIISIETSIDGIKEDIRNLSINYRDNQEQITVTGISALEAFSSYKDKQIHGTFQSVIQTVASVLSDLVNIRRRIIQLNKSRIRDELFRRTASIYALGISMTIRDYISEPPKSSGEKYAYERDVIYRANETFQFQAIMFEFDLEIGL